MVTKRKRYNGMYTEVHRVVGDEVKVTCCCCADAGATARECADSRNLKNPCRCDCHSKTIWKPKSEKKGGG